MLVLYQKLHICTYAPFGDSFPKSGGARIAPVYSMRKMAPMCTILSAHSSRNSISSDVRFCSRADEYD